jgi:isochorismate synthase
MRIVHVCAQKTGEVHRLSSLQTPTAAEGFLFTPFKESPKRPALLIKSEVYAQEGRLPLLAFAKASKPAVQYRPIAIHTTTQNEFIQQVEAIKSEIQRGEFKKIVAARVSTVKTPDRFNAVAFFKRLCGAYPHAFVSLVYTPLTGIWIGATPELLLAVDNKEYTTYSLAGTRPNTAGAQQQPWGTKEIEEQKIVSDYIKQALKKVTSVLPSIKGPETVVAANLLHLRTTFTYKGIPFNDWKKVVATLHPTPAVGGLPKAKAVSYIARHEKNLRQYYSGYLGPVNKNRKTYLYVNLRCMNVLNGQLAIYTGCGITSSSVAIKEWQETELKRKTLLNVLR